jgi:hypothetical protein
MKPNLFASLLVLPSLLVLLHAVPAAPSRAAVPVASSAAAVLAPDPAFKTKFKALMDKAAKPEMEKLVKAESGNASAWIARAQEILAERPDDPDSGPFLADLSAAWKASMKSEFPEKEKAFFAALEGQNKKDRLDVRKRWDKSVSDFDSNAEKRDAWIYSQLVDEIEVLASAFEQIGDHYYASEAWLMYAACYDEPLRGATADQKRAYQGYEKALTERAAVDLADAKKEAAEKRKKELAAKGFDKGGAPSGGGAPVPTPGSSEPTDAGATINVPLTFEIVPTVDAFQRPSFRCDDVVITWYEVGLQKKGSTATFENTPGAPTLYRVGSADIRFDSDGDGKGDGPADEKIPLTGNITPVKIMLGKGDQARPWAFLAVTAGQQENYQSVQLNMQPSDTLLRLFTLGAASVTGTVEGQPIRIIDDSMDGTYGQEPQMYGFVGVTKGVYQPDMDSIVIGASKRARPWSEFQQIGGKWWKLEMGVTGKEIKASPVKTDTGLLKLDFKGPVAPTYVILRGTNVLKNSFFDVVEGGSKGVEVPVGRYTLVYGEVRKGKKRQMQKCLILPGPHNSVSYDVTKGQTTLVTLGAPFGMDFEAKTEAGKTTITGKTVVITGSQGEHYERTWQCLPKPEVFWRKKGAKTGSKPTPMKFAATDKEIEDHGWDAAWFPLDLTIADAAIQGEIELQLVDKKHDLFGKIESAWK